MPKAGKEHSRKQGAAVDKVKPAPESLLPHIQHKEQWRLAKRELCQGKVITIENVLSPVECERLIEAAEAIGFEHQGSRGAAHGEAYRDNHRLALQSPQYAEQLWQQAGLRDVCSALCYQGKHAACLNPNLRFYRYGEGQRFGKHVDDSVALGDGHVTGFTVLLYLNGTGQSGRGREGRSRHPVRHPLQGGATVFYGDDGRALLSVQPLAGMALLHLHGDECLEHEGAAVQSGAKYILRSDIVFQ